MKKVILLSLLSLSLILWPNLIMAVTKNVNVDDSSGVYASSPKETLTEVIVYSFIVSLIIYIVLVIFNRLKRVKPIPGPVAVKSRNVLKVIQTIFGIISIILFALWFLMFFTA